MSPFSQSFDVLVFFFLFFPRKSNLRGIPIEQRFINQQNVSENWGYET